MAASAQHQSVPIAWSRPPLLACQRTFHAPGQPVTIASATPYSTHPGRGETRALPPIKAPQAIVVRIKDFQSFGFKVPYQVNISSSTRSRDNVYYFLLLCLSKVEHEIPAIEYQGRCDGMAGDPDCAVNYSPRSYFDSAVLDRLICFGRRNLKHADQIARHSWLVHK